MHRRKPELGCRRTELSEKTSPFMGDSQAEKWERLRHWLCSSHLLFAREPIAWIHAPSQPLMRSPLSRPKPRLLLAESAGFFRSGCPTGRPAGQITQPISDWQI